MAILAQFLFRVSFGLSAAMAITPPRQVTSGYFRNHLYVVMGMNVLAGLLALSQSDLCRPWIPFTVAGLSYVAAVVWMYEFKGVGRLLLAIIAAFAMSAAWTSEEAKRSATDSVSVALHWLDLISGGLLIGTTLAAMLLGHWYLNTPTMKLAPLRRLVLWIAASAVLRGLVCGAGAVLTYRAGWPDAFMPWFLTLRWLSGILGILIVAWMTWQTLKIPNTQSATGILYVGVILVFIGELTAMLLVPADGFPV